MTSSDSDSDSDDDDDFLNVSMFTKKRPSRQQSAKENKRANILDTLCSKQGQLLDRQARMNESIKKEQEGFVPDEKDKIDTLETLADEMRMGAGAGSGSAVKKEWNANANATHNDDGTPVLDSCSKNITYDINDPRYWSKIEAMKQNGNKSIHDRRRDIEDGINGFDMINEFGENPETYTQEDRDRMSAESAGRHSNLGTRRTFGWFHQNHSEGDDKGNRNGKIKELEPSLLAPFSSLKEATDGLNSILKKYDSTPKRGLDADARQKWNTIRNTIIKPMKKADALNILPQMLGRHWKPDLPIPLDLLSWLLRVSTSGMMKTSTELCHGAFTFANKVLENKMEVVEFDGTKQESTNSILDIADFDTMLSTNFGFWNTRSASASASSSATTPIDAEAVENLEKFDEPSGFEHVLKLWNSAIANDMIRVQSTSDETQKSLADMIATVLCAGLDPIFYSGHSLLEHQGILLHTLLERVRRESEPSSISETDDEIRVSDTSRKQIEYIAELAMNKCCEHFLILPNGDEEDNDNEGWLCMELMIRSWQTIPKHESVIIFYSHLCHLALQKFVGDICNWELEVQRTAQTMAKEENSIKPRYKTIAMAEVALGMLTKSSQMNSDGARLLATVRVAGMCEQVGIEGFMLNIRRATNLSRNRGFCESDLEANMLYDHLDHLCNILLHLKKSIRDVINPNMRRLKELVILLSNFYDKCKLKVSTWDKARKSEKRRQSSMCAFLEDKDGNDSKQ